MNSDESLIEKINCGDSKALEELFDRYDKLVLSAISAYAKIDPVIHREMTDTKMTVFWEGINKYDSAKGKFSTFIYHWFRWGFLNASRSNHSSDTVSMSAYIDESGECFVENYMENEGPLGDRGFSTSGDYSGSACEAVSRVELLKKIHNELEDEDERTKTIMTMRYTDKGNGKPYTLKEIGEVVNLSYESVRVIHDKVIHKLKQRHV